MLHRIMEVNTIEIAKTIRRKYKEVEWILLFFTLSLNEMFGFSNHEYLLYDKNKNCI